MARRGQRGAGPGRVVLDELVEFVVGETLVGEEVGELHHVVDVGGPAGGEHVQVGRGAPGGRCGGGVRDDRSQVGMVRYNRGYALDTRMRKWRRGGEEGGATPGDQWGMEMMVGSLVYVEIYGKRK